MLKLVGGYFAHKNGFLSLDSLHLYIFKNLFLGRSKIEMLTLLHIFLDATFERMLNPIMMTRLHEAKKNGHRIVILSSSPDFIVEAFAKKLSVELWWGTPYHALNQQEFSSIGKVLCGHAKSSILHQLMENWNIPKQSTFAYSDNILDLPFLQTAGNPVVVNPDRKLRKISKLNGWEIIEE